MYKFFLILITGFLFFTSQTNIFASDGEVDPFFLTGFGFDAPVRDTALLSNGKLIIAGDFTFIAGVPRKHIARINSDGSLDQSFNSATGVNGNINALRILPNGKILIVGTFTAFNGIAANKVALLNDDGTLDNSFNVGTGANFDVFTAVILSDGKILIGGNFSAYNGTARRGVARLNSDGSLDTSFTLSTDFASSANVYAITIQSDNKILIGGIFAFQTSSGLLRNVARVDYNGAFDSTFAAGTGVNSTVNVIAIQTDGTILIGGTFSTVNGVSQRGLARLAPTGVFDATFAPGNINSVLKILIQPDSKLLLVGDFPQPSPNFNLNLLRLNPDGSTDNSFNGTSSGTVNAILFQSDNKIIIGGEFSATPAIGGASPTGFIRLNSDGSRDTSYVLKTGAVSNDLYKVYVQPDGKLLLIGNIGTIGGLNRTGLARLNTDGTVDANFNPTIPYPKLAAVLPDNKIVVLGPGGAGNQYKIYRLNSDGSLESTSNITVINNAVGNEDIYDLAVGRDGKIILAGSFDTVNGVDRKGFVRFNLDGNIDLSLNPASNITRGSFNSITVLPDGRIIIAGSFTTFSTGATYIASVFRFNSDGTSDSIHNPPLIAGSITDLAVQSDGKILICGFLNEINAYPVKNVARLNLNGGVDYSFVSPTLTGYQGSPGSVATILSQPNGRYLIGGDFASANGVPRTAIARFNADNSLDTSFNPVITGINSPGIASMVQQADGKIVIIGSIVAVNNFQRRYIARLLNTAKTAFADYDGDGRADLSVFRPSNGTWYLNQSTADFAATAFGQNGDLIAPGDYDGDGKTDLAVFRPSNGSWYLQRSTLGFTQIQFGASGDLPMPADFYGDGKSEIAIFRPATGSWYIYNLTTAQTTTAPFGLLGDVPTTADYDGDGKADLAVFRPSNGTWYLQRSQLGFAALKFGTDGDKPVVGDYDGDGKSDLAVWRPSNGVWYIQQSTAGFSSTAFGIQNDLPAPADFDGDGKVDLGIFRPSAGTWYLQRSTQGFTAIQFGASGDRPTPNAFVQ